MMGSTAHHVYGIFDGGLNELVYVGRSRNPKLRFAAHQCTMLKDHVNKGLKGPFFFEILETSTTSEVAQAEQHWISYARFIGCNLLNRTLAVGSPPKEDHNSPHSITLDVRHSAMLRALAAKLGISNSGTVGRALEVLEVAEAKRDKEVRASAERQP